MLNAMRHCVTASKVLQFQGPETHNLSTSMKKKIIVIKDPAEYLSEFIVSPFVNLVVIFIFQKCLILTNMISRNIEKLKKIVAYNFC